jgi:hypothetical protein
VDLGRRYVRRNIRWRYNKAGGYSALAKGGGRDVYFLEKQGNSPKDTLTDRATSERGIDLVEDGFVDDQ